MTGLTTYSFADVHASINGPGGSINIGSDAGSADEGISAEWTEDKDTMTTGADGVVMHTLKQTQAGKLHVRLLKRSPINQLLMAMYNFQRQSGATWGNSTILVSDLAGGDLVTGQNVAFARGPANVWGKEAAVITWEFNVGTMTEILGSGSPSLFGLT